MNPDPISLHHGVTFVGGGNMATAMIEGLETLSPRPSVTVCDLNAQVLSRHAAAGRIATADLVEAVRDNRVVVLAIKPQHLADAMPDLARAIVPGTLVISVLAGVPTSTLESGLPDGVRVVRVMPNTPMAIGEGMSAVAPGCSATRGDVRVGVALCEPAGEVLVVKESRIDAITAVSGSGPAYFFRFCEVLVQAAREELDFSEAEASLLVSQTAKGAIAYLVASEGFPAGRLRKEVTSKGGTTAAALNVFDQGGLPDLARDALVAARNRAQELSASIQVPPAPRGAALETESAVAPPR